MAPRQLSNRSVYVPHAIATAFLLLLISFYTQVSQVEGKTESTVASREAEQIQILNKQAEAWNRGDIADFMSAYWKDEGLTFSSGGKTERGWQATLENYKKNYPDKATMGKLTFSELETQELGADAMLMLGRWYLERAEPIGGNFSVVWKRINNKWVIVHDHSSSLTKSDK